MSNTEQPQQKPEVHWRTDNIKPPGEPDRQTLEERRLDILDDPRRHLTGEELRAESCRKWGIPSPGDKPSRKDAINRAMQTTTARLAALTKKTAELIEAVELKQAEARHRELQRMVDEAGARVMRGEVRHTPSTAFRAGIFGGSK
jgi:hypothetical protein